MPVTLRSDVGKYLVYYMEENKGKFPGVDVERVFVRRYPRGLDRRPRRRQRRRGRPRKTSKSRSYKDLEPGDKIGKEGVEDTYDEYLRGTPGITRIQVDAFGQPTSGGKLVSQKPVPGDNLKLTLDPDVQDAGEQAMAANAGCAAASSR